MIDKLHNKVYTSSADPKRFLTDRSRRCDEHFSPCFSILINQAQHIKKKINSKILMHLEIPSTRNAEQNFGTERRERKKKKKLLRIIHKTRGNIWRYQLPYIRQHPLYAPKHEVQLFLQFLLHVQSAIDNSGGRNQKEYYNLFSINYETEIILLLGGHGAGSGMLFTCFLRTNPSYEP